MAGNSVVQRPSRWCSWRTVASIRFLVVFLLFSATTIWASPGSAQNWQRLDDGRVVIEVFGEKLAFFPEDGRIVRFMAPHSKELFDLEAAIADPPAARRRMAGLDRQDFVRVVVGNNAYWRQQQKHRKFLGRFDWSDIPQVGPGHALNFSVFQSRSNWPDQKRYVKLPNDAFPTAIGPGPSGFTAYPFKGIESVRPYEPRETRYALPGERRLEPSRIPLIVTCRWAGAPVRRCLSRLSTADLRVQIVWQWLESQFPESEWRLLDQRLGAVTDFVFIERSRGEFQ